MSDLEINQSAEKPRRVNPSKRMRFEVFKRDLFTCQYCGATAQQAILVCDHINPVSNGGLTEMDNLVTACEACNQGKSDRLLSSVPRSLSERAAEILDREAQIAGYQLTLRERRERIESDAQEVLDLFCASYLRDSIPKRDFAAIKRFVETIGSNDCFEAAEVACAKFYSGYERSFRYFCGICWAKYRREMEGRP